MQANPACSYSRVSPDANRILIISQRRNNRLLQEIRLYHQLQLPAIADGSLAVSIFAALLPSHYLLLPHEVRRRSWSELADGISKLNDLWKPTLRQIQAGSMSTDTATCCVASSLRCVGLGQTGEYSAIDYSRMFVKGTGDDSAHSTREQMKYPSNYSRCGNRVGNKRYNCDSNVVQKQTKGVCLIKILGGRYFKDSTSTGTWMRTTSRSLGNG